MTVPILVGQRVRLRPPEETDADARFALGVDADVHRMFGGSRSTLSPMTRERATEWVAGLTKHPHAWIIEVSGTPIGEIRLDRLNDHDRHATLAVGIFNIANLGRSYGTDAIHLVVDYGFSVLGLHRLGLRVLAFNQRALRAYQKCGFVIEGREREAALIDDEWHDDVIMGLLASDARRAE